MAIQRKTKTTKAKTSKKKKVEDVNTEEFEHSEDEFDESSNKQKQQNTNAMFENSVDTSFFYTNDKFINSIDNDEIIAKIQSKYPDLSDKNTDSVIKKNIIHFIEDDAFVKLILDYYSINIFELFKLLYKMFSTVFKGMYLVKIRKILENKNYVEYSTKRKFN